MVRFLDLYFQFSKEHSHYGAIVLFAILMIIGNPDNEWKHITQKEVKGITGFCYTVISKYFKYYVDSGVLLQKYEYIKKMYLKLNPEYIKYDVLQELITTL